MQVIKFMSFHGKKSCNLFLTHESEFLEPKQCFPNLNKFASNKFLKFLMSLFCFVYSFVVIWIYFCEMLYITMSESFYETKILRLLYSYKRFSYVIYYYIRSYFFGTYKVI